MKLPKDFENYFRTCWCDEDVEALLRGLDGEPSVSIRLNTSRLPKDSEPICADGRVPWCPEGIYLSERPAFTADPLLHAGAYYVQEASSMFLAHVLRSILNSPFSILHSPLSACLDLCAAPGGKSTLLRSLLPDDCQLVANEPVRARCQVLAENLAKWGHPNVLVTQAHAHDFPPLAFDLILADVPCSGEGMMRKEAEAVAQWSPAFVIECAALQRSIIEDIWPSLRPGGVLIYSTCTFNPEEDEQNVEWIISALGAEPVEIPIDPAWGIRGDLRRTGGPLPVFHFLPGQVRGEGFFCAVLRKGGEPESVMQSEREKKPSRRKEKKQKGRAAAPRTLADRLRECLTTLPTDLLDSPDAPRVELSLEDAVRYLQREALVLPATAPKGIVQVCFQGQRLGLMKNLGSRANNLYPKEWRIRSSYTTGHTLFPA